MSPASGTTPPSTSSERQAAHWVQQMFAGIAPRYDFLNHVLSLNIDRRWRKRLVARLAPVLERKDACVFDVCCGTGDVLLDLHAAGNARVFGADFCRPMLATAKKKGLRAGLCAQLVECDALELPIACGSIDAISIAFGLRNLANYEAGLREFHRVLKPNGALAILEFSQPRARFLKTAYALYSKVVLPIVGAAVSGSPQAYRYLPESVRKFPQPGELCAMMNAAGFEDSSFELLTGGIAALHVAHKSAARGTR